jgi:hypothetical protein
MEEFAELRMEAAFPSYKSGNPVNPVPGALGGQKDLSL